jgi:hypothetical protein
VPKIAPPRRFPATPVTAGSATTLTPSNRMVILTRVQSGVGLLTVEAGRPAARLGCAYVSVGGQSSIVCHSAGIVSAPRTGRNPMILARHHKLTVDLGQSRRLARLIFYGVAGVGSLVVTTFGGARIEAPVAGPNAGVTVFLSVYNVDGELVLRAEPPNAAATVRNACDVYGFDRISWRDDDNPVA